MRKGFTLIEMSIVLLIIGLLIGGILAGRSLIRTSRLQTVISDVSTYQGAITQFKQKYSALPGDMTNATSYWGTNPNCATSGGTGTGTQTCNGTGAGVIALSASAPYEQFLVWQHLANGGFIQGQFTGTSFPSNPSTYCQLGINCPRGKIGQTYFLQYSSGALGGAGFWAQNAGHYLVIGAMPDVGYGTPYSAMPFLTGSEALSLDTKADDGLPGTGLWKSFNANGTPGYTPYCVIATDTGSPPPDGSMASAVKSIYQTNGNYVNASNICSLAVSLSF